MVGSVTDAGSVSAPLVRLALAGAGWRKAMPSRSQGLPMKVNVVAVSHQMWCGGDERLSMAR